MMRYSRNRFDEDNSCQRRTNCERNNACTSFNGNRCENEAPCERERSYGCERGCGRERSTFSRTAQCAATSRGESANTCEAERLLTLIRRLDFALVETNLYLDTHPYSRTALNYFERLLCERNQAAKRYETAFGPLTAMGNGTRDEWTWSTGAWPWQIDKESKR